jgi:hypothetical protein
VTISFEEAREARRVTSALAREAMKDGVWDSAEGLVEAKRQLGIAISIRWPDRLAEIIEEQG